MAIKVLLVDDHGMFPAGMRALLERERDFEVVGEASRGEEGVDLVRSLKPDVVVMDLSMPGSDGLEATRRITALGFKTKVLVLTAHAEEEYLVPVVEAGASGYLTKDERRSGPRDGDSGRRERRSIAAPQGDAAASTALQVDAG